MTVDSIAPTGETVRRELASLEANLIEEFCPPLSPDEVRDSCADAHASLEFAEIRSYVVVLVEHDVRQKLRRILDRRIATPDT